MHCPPLRPLPSPQHLTGIGLALCHSEGSSSSNPKHIARMIFHLVWRRQLPATEIERHHLQAPCIPRVVRLVQGADMIPAHPKQTEHAHGKSSVQFKAAARWPRIPVSSSPSLHKTKQHHATRPAPQAQIIPGFIHAGRSGLARCCCKSGNTQRMSMSKSFPDSRRAGVSNDPLPSPVDSTIAHNTRLMLPRHSAV